jgi:hypothetical protein
MLRIILGIVAGFVVWFLVASVGNVLFRVSWPGYAQVEATMMFGPAILTGRLLLGVMSSLCGGFVAAWIAKGNATTAKILGAGLTLFFLPVHYGLWDKFPIWYHALFLVSLFPITLIGALLFVRSRRSAPAAQDSH